VEAIILLPDQATVDTFRKGEGALEQTPAHDSASSFTGPVSTCKAYAIADDSIFNLCLNGELPCTPQEADQYQAARMQVVVWVQRRGRQQHPSPHCFRRPAARMLPEVAPKRAMYRGAVPTGVCAK
jgi:hypothetical protein